LQASEKQRCDRGYTGVLAQKIPRARDHLERGCLVADEFGRGDVLPQGVGASWVVDVRPGVGGGVEVLRGVSIQQSPEIYFPRRLVARKVSVWENAETGIVVA
jgi:hypothetical protein